MSSRRGPWSTGNKFGAKRVELDGHVFDSKIEAKRYQDLKLVEKIGQLNDLKVHTRWPLSVGGILIGHYESDFDYSDSAVDHRVVEDVKGCKTPLYLWKRRHFEAQYGFAITEIRK